MLTRRTLLAGLAATPLIPAMARAVTPSAYALGGIAIHGYDPVAYFTDAAPVAGDPAISANWMGAQVLFATSANRDRFLADPDTHAPRYGGYCAYAMSKGSIGPTVPEAWTVHKGRLYLNVSLRARELWLQDVPGNIAKADGDWPGILNS